ncbi:MAG: hypothetical protein AAFV53_26540 [Myxococcota bacterium]
MRTPPSGIQRNVSMDDVQLILDVKRFKDQSIAFREQLPWVVGFLGLVLILTLILGSWVMGPGLLLMLALLYGMDQVNREPIQIRQRVHVRHHQLTLTTEADEIVFPLESVAEVRVASGGLDVITRIRTVTVFSDLSPEQATWVADYLMDIANRRRDAVLRAGQDPDAAAHPPTALEEIRKDR